MSACRPATRPSLFLTSHQLPLPARKEHKLFIGMLPKAADEAAVRAVFQPFGEITEVRADGEAWKKALSISTAEADRAAVLRRSTSSELPRVRRRAARSSNLPSAAPRSRRSRV